MVDQWGFLSNQHQSKLEEQEETKHRSADHERKCP